MEKANLTNLIGNTKVVRLKNLEKYLNIDNELYLKMELTNPSGSIKDRACLNMILNYQKEGKLKEGSTIIEATSGNMGISLAMLSQYFHYRCIIVMPSSMSIQRRELIKSYNGEIVLIDGGMKESSLKALELQKEIPNSIIFDQFNNQNNYLAHYLYTAPEVFKEIPDLDYLFCSFGTGGTISGNAKYIKEHQLKTTCIAIEPSESPLLTKGYASKHLIQGIGANFIPSILQKDEIDEFISVAGNESIEMAKLIYQVEGLYVGISSGANVLGMINYLKEHHLKGKKALTFAMDKGERYTW